jgi:hypothetical protein
MIHPHIRIRLFLLLILLTSTIAATVATWARLRSWDSHTLVFDHFQRAAQARASAYHFTRNADWARDKARAANTAAEQYRYWGLANKFTAQADGAVAQAMELEQTGVEYRKRSPIGQ